MNLPTIAACVVVSLSLVYWAFMLWGSVQVARLPDVLGLSGRPLDAWPKVSLIIPACNEAETLEPAMCAKLQSTYPNLEIILIDDRSTDETPAIVDSLARRDSRLIPLHLTTLPMGWLGKVNAMNEGVVRATGEWLLFSDADVHVANDTLERVISHCEEEKLDHFSLWPTLWPVSPLIDTAFLSFTRLGLVLGRSWKTSDSGSNATVGVGAFNLVRRSAFEATAGFEWLRMETADDYGLAQMIKRSGGRSNFAHGGEHVGLHFVHSMAQAARSAEKGATVFKFRLRGVFAFAVAMLSLEAAPFAALFTFGTPLLVWLGAAGTLLALTASGVIARASGQKLTSALLTPIGSPLILGLTIRGGWLAWRNQGIRWRGTLYPASALLAGRRIDFV